MCASHVASLSELNACACGISVCAVAPLHYTKPRMAASDNHVMLRACRGALGERFLVLMQEDVTTSYDYVIRQVAAELDDADKRHALLRCIDYPPTLSTIPATAVHIGFNGAVAPHKDPEDVNWSLIVWYQVGGARIAA